ncbi:MAG: sodium:proton antiporter NhaD [Rhabdochlamydiaceae bacterium]
MDITSWKSLLIVLVFCIGYVAIILEYYIKVNKSAVALLIAVLCWAIYLGCSTLPVGDNVNILGHHLAEISQIIFFLMGAMALVELIDSHRGFKMITDRIKTKSTRKMLWVIALVTFFLSAVLDNLTTTILMVSLLRKLVPQRAERFLLCCIVVIAANAGGAWTPIGDVTTTMLWINGQLTSIAVMKSLFLPSIISMLIPLAWYTMRTKGKLSTQPSSESKTATMPGARAVFYFGVGGLVFVPIFKGITGLPPFMGVILALAVLWLITDLIHFPYKEREHLRVPHILTRVDTSGILFFLGILLCVGALQTAGILQVVADWLDVTFKSQATIATLIGFFSAVIDNVPLVAATMGMYPLQAHPTDSSFWHMIAYAAGTGGSMLIIGSSAGVALMGMEKIDFISYAKKVTVPVAFGYLAGMGVYLLLRPFLA